MTKSAATPLDGFDHAILAAVQRDNQQSHARIGEAVGLSASAVRRRLARLRASGVIEADVSVLSLDAGGLGFLVSVSFAREDPATVAAFRRQIQTDPAVSQAWSVSGETDFVLLVHAATSEAFEAWGHGALMANPAIARYSTALIFSRVKFAPGPG